MTATLSMRSRGHVRLWCAVGHDHVMTPEQARRLAGTPCCWCGRLIHRLPAEEDRAWMTLRRLA